MWRIIVLGFLAVCASCGFTQRPEDRTVAAYEVPLPTEEARSAFLDLLRQDARAEGLHVDAATPEELAETAKVMPGAAMTIHAAIWRGEGDDQPEAVILDLDHVGLAWIAFSAGKDEALARRFRERAVRRILQRWPQTLSLPVMPNGSIPLRRDLRRTAHGYEVDPREASKYGRP